ncbi:ArgS-related anticodon-binding protein NrtL [Streptomyces sp. NPDC032198]|uniref:ArgS-related anticodon-binding protein NrtL n=1 Tax=Streptomyces sp. NPDC032198 TaxID=3155127 RepID=UPI0033F3E5C9
MTPVELSRTVLRAMRRAVDDGELRGLGELSDLGEPGGLGGPGGGESDGTAPTPWRVVVERPRPGGCGDYATNVALQVARAAGQSPREVAEVLSPRLAGEPGIAAIDITGPGFLNITLDRGTDTASHLGSSGSAALVRDVLERGPRYGHVDPEPVDAPRAPLALHTLRFPCEPRAAVLADSLRRILRSQGTLVRLTCDEAPDPRWAAAGLGVHVDTHGTPPADAGTDADTDAAVEIIRPVPVPVPVPLPAPAAAPDPLLSLGPDAARWALLYPAAHDRPRISDEHLVQRASNPLFRVRYAYSRTRALTRNAAALGFTSAPGDVTALPSRIPSPGRPLLDALADHPRILAAAARHRAPDRLARHLVVVADAFLAFQPAVLPLGDEKPSAAHRARLALAEAAGTVLAGGLSLLGISAPEYL